MAWRASSSASPTSARAPVPEALDAIAEVIRGHAGVWLLDRTADADHQRSVYTMAGYPGRVMTAMERAVEVAIGRIDMRAQRGKHPRIGAVDVIPFVPLGDTTMEQCVEGARRFAATLAERFDLPVFLYAEAALRPDRRVLADIRRPGFEGLAAAMRQKAQSRTSGQPRRTRRPAPPSWAHVPSSSPGTSSCPPRTWRSRDDWPAGSASAMAGCRRCRRWASTLRRRGASSSR